MGNQEIDRILLEMYRRLLTRHGPQHWWPAEEPFEVIVGAILTQSASWKNVEKAITSLKAHGALSPSALRELPQEELATIIRSSGYYNVKARKLRAFAQWFGDCYYDSLDSLFKNNIEHLRGQLLGIFGIGEETADSIILYAGNRPIFVIDAYTRRIIDRLGMAPEHDSYSAYQDLFMGNLPSDVKLFNEYHALLVNHAKNICRTKPDCRDCCLEDICRYNK